VNTPYLKHKVQEHEARVLDLTGQVAQLAREKQGIESQLREMSRQLVSTQQSNVQFSSQLSELKSQTHGAENWEREKQVCTYYTVSVQCTCTVDVV
jgi:chromosome segregation ATPase